MEVAPVLYRDHVEIYFKNTSSVELRLWELWNSWGYWSISFELRDERAHSLYTIVRRRDTDFTRNFPSYFALAPGERHALYMDLGDGWWERDEAIAHLKDIPLSVRISYLVTPSQEADELGVFVGSVVSDWVTSLPPHDWLFTQTPNWEELATRLRGRSPDDVLYIFCNEIESQARLIELKAMLIHEDSLAASTVLGEMSPQMTVDHAVNSILEITAAIRHALREKRIYMGSKPSLRAGSVTTGTQSED